MVLADVAEQPGPGFHSLSELLRKLSEDRLVHTEPAKAVEGERDVPEHLVIGRGVRTGRDPLSRTADELPRLLRVGDHREEHAAMADVLVRLQDSALDLA